RSRCAAGSNPFTSHAKRVASADASNRVIGAAPLTPRSKASQDSRTVFPTGVIAPIPVTTARRTPASLWEGVGARSLMGRVCSVGGRRVRRAADRQKSFLATRHKRFEPKGFGERCARGIADATPGALPIAALLSSWNCSRKFGCAEPRRRPTSLASVAGGWHHLAGRAINSTQLGRDPILPLHRLWSVWHDQEVCEQRRASSRRHHEGC